MDIEARRKREKDMVSRMIGFYCRKKHKSDEDLCDDCARLKVYAMERSDKCPFMERKSFCTACKVRCYNPEMREKIRAVMRFCGPRMLVMYPAAAIKHMLCRRENVKK